METKDLTKRWNMVSKKLKAMNSRPSAVQSALTVCTYSLICFFFADVLSPWHDLPSDTRHKPQIYSNSTFGLFGTRDLMSAFIYSSFSGSRASYPCLPLILLFISSSRPKMQSLAKATVSKRRVAVSLATLEVLHHSLNRFELWWSVKWRWWYTLR